ncbi:MAG: hypothetical protein JXR76_19480 [Deltaproteobacteria bacterium]|nr:hypothetical protein [Deltaproteobacteria bacterium]
MSCATSYLEAVAASLSKCAQEIQQLDFCVALLNCDEYEFYENGYEIYDNDADMVQNLPLPCASENEVFQKCYRQNYAD